MLRKAINNQLHVHLEMIHDLEELRTKKYGHLLEHAQVVMSTDEAAGYENYNRTIMHYEGRIKEARSILRIIDDVELRVHADKCTSCGHHEIGTVDHNGKFIALNPGSKVLVRRV
jgi:hypothetical protein